MTDNECMTYLIALSELQTGPFLTQDPNLQGTWTGCAVDAIRKLSEHDVSGFVSSGVVTVFPKLAGHLDIEHLSMTYVSMFNSESDKFSDALENEMPLMTTSPGDWFSNQTQLPKWIVGDDGYIVWISSLSESNEFSPNGEPFRLTLGCYTEGLQAFLVVDFRPAD